MMCEEQVRILWRALMVFRVMQNRVTSGAGYFYGINRDWQIEYASIVDKALAAVPAGQVQDNWQPIETVLKQKDNVDLWAGNQRYPDCFWSQLEDGWICPVQYETRSGRMDTVFTHVESPTHWMTLPQPPKVKEGQV